MRLTGMFLIFALLSGCALEQRTPEQAETLFQEGLRFSIDGNFAEARPLFARVLPPGSENLQVIDDVLNGRIERRTALLYFQAIEKGERGQQREKIALLSEAIAREPHYALAYNERGIAFSTLEKFEASLADRQRAIDIDPNYPSPHYNKAVICEKIGRLEEALESYRAFLKVAPPHYQDHIEYARFRIEELEKVVSLNRAFS